MTHRWTRGWTLGLLILSLSACRGGGDAGPGYDLRLDLSPTPPAVGPARLTFRLSGPQGDPVEGASVEVLGTMTHPGMIPVSARAEPREPGRYVVDAFDFTMAGDWILQVRVAPPGEAPWTRDFPVRAVGAAPGGGEGGDG